MRLDQEFSIDTIPQSERSYDLVAPGWYPAVIKNAEVKTTREGSGKYIALRFDIMGDKSAGRVVFANINIRNPNPKAEEIGVQQLGEIMRSTGLTKVVDTDQLIGLQLQIKVDIRKSEQYGDSNEVKGYKAISAAATISIGKTEPAPTPATENVPPWKKKTA